MGNSGLHYCTAVRIDGQNVTECRVKKPWELSQAGQELPDWGGQAYEPGVSQAQPGNRFWDLISLLLLLGCGLWIRTEIFSRKECRAGVSGEEVGLKEQVLSRASRPEKPT